MLVQWSLNLPLNRPFMESACADGKCIAGFLNMIDQLCHDCWWYCTARSKVSNWFLVPIGYLGGYWGIHWCFTGGMLIIHWSAAKTPGSDLFQRRLRMSNVSALLCDAGAGLEWVVATQWNPLLGKGSRWGKNTSFAKNISRMSL